MNESKAVGQALPTGDSAPNVHVDDNVDVANQREGLEKDLEQVKIEDTSNGDGQANTEGENGADVRLPLTDAAEEGDGDVKVEVNGQEAIAKVEKDASNNDSVKLERLSDAGDDSPSAETKEETASDASSPQEDKPRKAKPVTREPQLFDHLPSTKDEAAKTFEELAKSYYQNKQLGVSSQNEIMTCDCWQQWEDGQNMACGPDSDCINRLTSMECVDDSGCNCGDECQNQRFQRRQYADIDVIKTQKKGYGLRANSDFPPDHFIYEYVGDVITEPQFRKRMVEYDKSGVKHFYFMMLQKGEFIDATKRGGFARFANHSCNPNCYVDKWVVGTHLRMGIFSKRPIKAGEELTFDYNVDRYGAQAQPCYCGEPNCIGFIGGKTQTGADNTKMTQTVRDALGLEDEEDWETATAKKKKRRKGETDEEYAAKLAPKAVTEKGVTKIMSTLMQSKEQWMVNKLLTRIRISEDPAVHRRVMRMHGYQILGTVLSDYKSDPAISTTILEVLLSWPRVTKNKISSSSIEDTVKELSGAEDEVVRGLAEKLLGEWSTLEMAYRIPRRAKTEASVDSAAVSEAAESPKPTPIEAPKGPAAERAYQGSGIGTPTGFRPPFPRLFPPRPRPMSRGSFGPGGPPMGPRALRGPDVNALPPGWEEAQDDSGRTYYYNKAEGKNQWTRPMFSDSPKPVVETKPDLQSIIEAAKASLAQKEEAEKKAQEVEKDGGERKERKEKPPTQKLLEKVLAPFVSNTVNKYYGKSGALGKDDVKKYAKELAAILVQKEIKAGKTEKDFKELSEEKKKKVKGFIVSYMDKLMAHKKKKGAKGGEKESQSSSQGGSQTPMESMGDASQSEVLPKSTEDTALSTMGAMKEAPPPPPPVEDNAVLDEFQIGGDDFGMEDEMMEEASAAPSRKRSGSPEASNRDEKRPRSASEVKGLESGKTWQELGMNEDRARMLGLL
ncbi:hypothetical protein SAICODRAFT_90338 [Saitoella complicata NRRL Y-17804]|nr:uncharacterized protein SAICODRAFT_90338 [Saitoella complicata NRRL Y-17804]ODQ54554.1 hypothetical protein SAICODRAFT_90338 [Saitoella complicata NRRL Y-17804]